MKPCTHRTCPDEARWRIVGKPVICCDTHLDTALNLWPGARVVPLPQDPHHTEGEQA